jgi:4'-phosphopantetheinyl transferase EntD
VIAELLPSCVATAELFADPPGLSLFLEEQPCVSRAVRSRQAEFTTGRHCARMALARLGLTAQAILKGERGAPQWPADVVGSITHCAGYRAAAVARPHDLASIGIDAEPNEPLPANVLGQVALARERAMLARLSAVLPDIAWDRLLFSAKESVYKAWFPLTGTFLDFDSADISVDPPSQSFVADLLVPGPVVDGHVLSQFAGRFMVRHGLTVTVVTCD